MWGVGGGARVRGARWWTPRLAATRMGGSIPIQGYRRLYRGGTSAGGARCQCRGPVAMGGRRRAGGTVGWGSWLGKAGVPYSAGIVIVLRLRTVRRCWGVRCRHRARLGLRVAMRCLPGLARLTQGSWLARVVGEGCWVLIPVLVLARARMPVTAGRWWWRHRPRRPTQPHRLQRCPPRQSSRRPLQSTIHLPQPLWRTLLCQWAMMRQPCHPYPHACPVDLRPC